MSSISVNTILDASGGTTTSINGYTPTVSNMAGRNRIINGDMRIDQRNAGAAVTPANTYTLDRWIGTVGGATGKYSVQQNAGSVTPPVGFTNYLGVTSLSAYSVTASDFYIIRHLIEGYSVSDLAYGTASAATVSLSFWVRSSLTGNFGVVLTWGSSSANQRAYPILYTITSANTWEYKTIVIPGDTTMAAGGFETTNSRGFQLRIGIGGGADNAGPSGAWATSNYQTVTGATSVVGTSGATFYITGVQLEAGSVATPFERRQYGQELALCYRYFQKSFAYGTAPANGLTSYGDSASTTSYATAVPYIHVTYPVQLRTIPTTVTLYNPRVGGTAGQATNGASDATSTAAVNSGEKGFMVQTSSQVANNWYVHWTATSEL